MTDFQQVAEAGGAVGGSVSRLLRPLQRRLAYLSKQVKEQPTFRWAYVTSVDPLQIMLEGDDEPLEAVPSVAAAVPGVGGKVLVLLQHRQCTIVGSDATFPTGTITAYGGATAPAGWLLCDGSVYFRSAYPALFAVIGNATGTASFNVPNLRGRVPVGIHTDQTEFNTLGKTGGARTHTLTEAQMPSHSHNPDGQARFITTSRTSNPGTRADNPGYPGSGAYMLAFSDNNLVRVESRTASAGSGQAHNNLQPYLVVNYIIKT